MLEDPAAKVPNLESIIGVGLPSLFEKLACPSDGFIVRKPRNSFDARYMAGSHEVAAHGSLQSLTAGALSRLSSAGASQVTSAMWRSYHARSRLFAFGCVKRRRRAGHMAILGEAFAPSQRPTSAAPSKMRKPSGGLFGYFRRIAGSRSRQASKSTSRPFTTNSSTSTGSFSRPFTTH